jgi:hypothetical protein
VQREGTIPFPIPSREGTADAGRRSLIAGALRRLGNSFTFDAHGPPLTLDILDQGETDPGNIVEFLAPDIDFEVEPTTGFVFPPEADRG